jgi:hypothetical protein
MSKRNRKSNKLQTNTVVPGITDDSGLDSLISAITGTPEADPAVPTNAAASEVLVADEGDLQAAVNAIETQEHYEAMGATETPAETPVTETPAVEATEPVAAKSTVKRSKLSAEEKAKRETERAAKKAERAEKAALKKAEAASKPKRIYFGANKVERMKHTIGEAALNDLAVLNVNDAALGDEDLKAKQAEVIGMIDGMSSKVKNRATYLLEFAAGKKASLNKVIGTVFETLAKDGTIKSGDKGNYFEALVAKGYKIGTVRAAGNNSLSLLKQLQVLTVGEKGNYVPNPDSMLLGNVMGKLGLTLPKA